MSFQNGIKFRSMIEFWEWLPEKERILTDVLRQIILEQLPTKCREKLTYNVPFYYGKKRICLIWPASVPWGGFKKGVFLGFCQGDKLKDPDNYLEHGTNKKIYYRIFHSEEEINVPVISALLREAVAIDGMSA